MKRSTDRILTSHAGSLFRPDDLRELIAAKSHGQPHEEEALAKRIRSSVAEVVQQQARSGIDIINDGEQSKTSFGDYVGYRLGGLDPEPTEPYVSMIAGRDMKEFPEYHATRRGFGGTGSRGAQVRRMLVPCVGPLTYTGQATLKADIENFKAALQGVKAEETFLPAISPGSIEHWMTNQYYPNEEAFLYAIADAMHEEYKAIVDAGFILQVDDPDLADAWQLNPDMDVAEYRKLAEMRVDVLNHGLRDIPIDRVRLHVCWGSGHGPHKNDLPLKHIVDIILKVRAECYSLEASNPRHDHDWQVWEEIKLPAGKILMPGVVGHVSDHIEHPELVAERLIRYAKLVGRENVMAGTDCGLGGRVGHPEIVWAKFQAMVEGAQLATKKLWA